MQSPDNCLRSQVFNDLIEWLDSLGHNHDTTLGLYRVRNCTIQIYLIILPLEFPEI